MTKTLTKNDHLTVAIGGRFLESEGALNDAAREVPVLIIKEGMGNKVDRHFYSAALLERVASKFDGVKAYADHPTKTQERDQPERSVRQIVGYYHSPKVVVIEGQKAISATLKIIEGEAYAWAWELVKEAAAFAKKFKEKEFVGISINAWGKSHEEERHGAVVNVVDDFTEVQSADIVTQAGAGGGFRLREAVKKALQREAIPPERGTMDMKTELTKHGAALKALHEQIKSNPDHATAYGPAVEALMSHHSEMEKCAASAPVVGDPAAETPEMKKEAEKRAADLKDFEKLTEAYKAGKLGPVEKALYESIVSERAATKIKEDAAMVANLIREAAIPEAYASDLPAMCAGKPEADVKKVIETRKKLVEAAGRATGAGEGGANGQGDKSKLGDKLKGAGIKLVEKKA